MNYGKIIIFYLFAFLLLFTCLFIYFLFEIFFFHQVSTCTPCELCFLRAKLAERVEL